MLITNIADMECDEEQDEIALAEIRRRPLLFLERGEQRTQKDLRKYMSMVFAKALLRRGMRGSEAGIMTIWGKIEAELGVGGENSNGRYMQDVASSSNERALTWPQLDLAIQLLDKWDGLPPLSPTHEYVAVEKALQVLRELGLADAVLELRGRRFPVTIPSAPSLGDLMEKALTLS